MLLDDYNNGNGTEKVALKIVKVETPTDKYNIKCPYKMKPIGITIHNTANKASAVNEISYMLRNNNEVSFHFAVDDKEAVQGLPLDRNGWHASDGNKGTGNRKTIAIEICHSINPDETKFDKSEDNAARLCAILCIDYGWTTANIKRHYDYAPNKKYCPHKTMDKGWSRFLKMVQRYIDKLKEEKQPKEMTLYRVQVGAYSIKANAEKMKAELKALGIESYIITEKRPVTN